METQILHENPHGEGLFGSDLCKFVGICRIFIILDKICKYLCSGGEFVRNVVILCLLGLNLPLNVVNSCVIGLFKPTFQPKVAKEGGPSALFRLSSPVLIRPCGLIFTLRG